MKVKEFARLMDAFILQISDDVLREQLESALCRLLHKAASDEAKELAELGLGQGEDTDADFGESGT